MNRSYKLKVYGNKVKTDTALYTLNRFKAFSECFIGKLFFNGNRHISTVGMGDLADKAQKKCFGVVRSLHALQKEGIKTNVPYKPDFGCPGMIYPAKKGAFDYWISVSNLWTKRSVVALPAKSHKALNGALKNGWKIIPNCELKIINGNLYAIVFVSKETSRMKKFNNVLGCDVGLKHSVSCSDRYLGHGLKRAIRTDRIRTAERRRQGHKVSSKVKTLIKQILDREAKTVLRRSQRSLSAIAVESPKRLANLRSGKLQGWARSYFANRLHILGKENGVLILDINPYQTSQTCSKCGIVDKKSRRSRDEFVCASCGHKDHADTNASVVIAQKGAQMLAKKSAIRMSKFLAHT